MWRQTRAYIYSGWRTKCEAYPFCLYRRGVISQIPREMTITPLRILNAQRLPTFALINRRQVGILNVQRCKGLFSRIFLNHCIQNYFTNCKIFLFHGFYVCFYTGEDLKWDTPQGCHFKSLQIPRH